MALYPNFKDESVAAREIEAGYITYATLADYVGDMILCNAMGERELEEVSGGIVYYEGDGGERIPEAEYYEELERLRDLDDPTEEEEDRLYELEDFYQVREPEEVFQWFIISDSGADFLERFAPEEQVYYDNELDVYVWGITHWGTNWSYVFTDIPVRKEDE